MTHLEGLSQWMTCVSTLWCWPSAWSLAASVEDVNEKLHMADVQERSPDDDRPTDAYRPPAVTDRGSSASVPGDAQDVRPYGSSKKVQTEYHGGQ
jgi:hypothetical protein